jgi:hypothetical protein
MSLFGASQAPSLGRISVFVNIEGTSQMFNRILKYIALLFINLSFVKQFDDKIHVLKLFKHLDTLGFCRFVLFTYPPGG